MITEAYERRNKNVIDVKDGRNRYRIVSDTKIDIDRLVCKIIGDECEYTDHQGNPVEIYDKDDELFYHYGKFDPCASKYSSGKPSDACLPCQWLDYRDYKIYRDGKF
jgi:hypothetical protein